MMCLRGCCHADLSRLAVATRLLGHESRASSRAAPESEHPDALEALAALRGCLEERQGFGGQRGCLGQGQLLGLPLTRRPTLLLPLRRWPRHLGGFYFCLCFSFCICVCFCCR